ncbi:MAG: hypothetical protein WC838_00020 [Candidatus Margulisiibacteriota bacterium]|jgi:hypothetical protein
MHYTSKGFSLLEAVVVLGVTALLCSAFFASGRLLGEKNVLQAQVYQMTGDLNWLRERAMLVGSDCTAELEANSYSLRSIAMDGTTTLLKQRSYPHNCLGQPGRLGFTASGSAKYAGTITLQHTSGDKYKITVAPVTGKISLKKA